MDMETNAMDGDGMMAVVRSLPHAGLTVTLLDCGRQYTIVPSEHQQITQRIQHHRGAPGAQGGSELRQEGVKVKRESGVQATDGRYSSTYKVMHCHASPTSPPLEVTEFPPQRSEVYPGHGNFEVGGMGSGETNARPRRSDGYRGGLSWSDRGSVFEARPSQQPDAFASSLRKYPNLSPERSTEIIEKLISYPQARSYEARPQREPSSEARPNNYTRHDDYPTRDRSRRAHGDNVEPWRRSTFARTSDVRYLQNVTSRLRDGIRCMERTPSVAVKRNNSVNMKLQASAEMVSREVATTPTPTPLQRTVAVPVTPTPFSNSVEIDFLHMRQREQYNLVSQTVQCALQTETELNADSSDFFNHNQNFDEENLSKINRISVIRNLMNELGIPINDPACSKQINFNRIKKTSKFRYSDSDLFNENEHNIEQMTKKYVEKASPNNLSIQIKHHNLVLAVRNWLDIVIIRNGIKLDPMEKDFILKYLVQRLSKYDNMVANHWKYKLKADIVDLLNKPESKVNATIIIHKLTDLLIEKIRSMYRKKCKKNFGVDKNNKFVKKFNVLPIKSTFEINRESKSGQSTSLKKMNTVTVMSDDNPIPTECQNKIQITQTENAMSKSDQADKKYIDDLQKEIKEWMNSLDLANLIHNNTKESIIFDMAKDIYERQNYLVINHKCNISNEKELDYLEYQIFKWTSKLIGSGNKIPSEHMQDLWYRIKNIFKSKVSDSFGHHLKDINYTFTTSKFCCKKVCFDPVTCLDNANLATSKIPKASSEIKKVIICNQNFIESRNVFDQKNQPEQLVDFEARSVCSHKPGTDQCCSNPYFDRDFIDTELHLYEDYKRFVEDWVKEIPISSNTPEEKTIAEKARLGIHNGIWKAVTKLNSNPTVYSNQFLYEDLLESEIDNLIDCLPQTTELKAKRHLLKVELIEKTIQNVVSMYQNMITSFKNQLVLNVYNHLQSLKFDVVENVDVYSIIMDIAELYILFTKNIKENKVKADIYSIKILKGIEELFEVLLKLNNNLLNSMKLDTFKIDLIRVLQNAHIPGEADLEIEANNVLMGFEIDQWLLDLPLLHDINSDNGYHKINLRDKLLRQLKEVNKNIDMSNECISNQLREEICKFLECLPLQKGDSLNIPFAIDELLNRINNMRLTQQISTTSKRVAFVEPKDYNDFSQNIPFSSTMNPLTSQTNNSQQNIKGNIYQASYMDNKTDNPDFKEFKENILHHSIFNDTKKRYDATEAYEKNVRKDCENNNNVNTCVNENCDNPLCVKSNALNVSELKINESDDSRGSDIFELCHDGEAKDIITKKHCSIGCQANAKEKSDTNPTDNSSSSNICRTSNCPKEHLKSPKKYNPNLNDKHFDQTVDRTGTDSMMDANGKFSRESQTNTANNSTSRDMEINVSYNSFGVCECPGTSVTYNNEGICQCRFRNYNNRSGTCFENPHNCPNIISLFYPYPWFL